MSLLPSIIGAAAIGSMPRLSGSVARVWADRKAPDDIRNKTVGREALHLGSAMVLPALLSPLFLKNMPKLLGPASFWAKEMGATVLAATTGLAGAEVISRKFFPTAKWSDRVDMMERDDDYESSHHDHDDDDTPRVGGRLDVTSSPSFSSQAFSVQSAPNRSPSSQFPTSQMLNAPMKPSSFSVSV
jgi:hypothetical protein